jgi:hypothetical protein
MYTELNAWNEILARTFVKFQAQDNVSPAWLVNPATRRRLKLDRYYPEAGVAVRFVGLLAKGQGRQSDWEVQETEQRDQTRAELCRQQGVQLLLIDASEDPLKQMDLLLRILAGASRTLAQSERPLTYKQTWMPELSTARETANQLRSLIAKNPEQMLNNLAESWRDREARLSTPAMATTTSGLATRPPGHARPAIAYVVGQRLRHERFGEGVVTNTTAPAAEATITILFDGAQERTFLLGLVQDKLTALP